MKILTIKNLNLKNERNYILKNIDFCFEKKRILGIVGESGSGKSMLSKTILGLLTDKFKVEGEIIFKNKNLLEISERQFQAYRGKEISMVFQNPMTSLNPVVKIKKQLQETIINHDNSLTKEEIDLRIENTMRDVGLNPEMVKYYPHQLSGGQKQRVVIANAIINRPYLLIADEPTTALDVTTQKQILDLFKELRDKYDLSIIFISHDLSVIEYISEDILVMYKGKIIEKGELEQVLNNPQNDYTKSLIRLKPENYIKNENKILEETNFNKKNKKLILAIKKIKKRYKKKESLILNNLSLDIYENEVLGIVGESGSGKSTLGKCILGLEKVDSGNIFFSGKNEKKDIQSIFQDPYSTLNPFHTVGWHLEEPLKAHTNLTKEERKKKSIKYLKMVGLTEEYYYKLPKELSGGERQRVTIVTAIILNPKIIVADESISALDISNQAQILNIFMEMKNKLNLTIIFITHDLSVVKYFCDRVAVINSGEIVEIGKTDKIIQNPKHEYTKKLLSSRLTREGEVV
ncbi:MAG: ABC transporter ATP-binding protein [Cetobacterium sp.]|uniref:ABC transporter ATP-binding protein n=1 Tax=Cetobacterium sp. TaxID=2071632 RepID=UPI0025F9181A|nr:ABC transporter ATP-binding protein [uncultured Cetobacterium sp.]